MYRRCLGPLVIMGLCSACGPADELPQEELSVNVALGTVVTVSWQSEGSSEGWVEFGLPGELDRTTPASAAEEGQHEAVLLGLKPSTGYELRAATLQDGVESYSEVVAVDTGPMDPALPDLSLVWSGSEEVADYQVLSLSDFSGDGSWAVVLDQDLGPTWAYQVPGDAFRARASRFSGDFLVGTFSGEEEQGGGAAPEGSPSGVIYRISPAGDQVEEQQMPGGLVDFVEVEDGLLAGLLEFEFQVDGYEAQIMAEKLVEIDGDGDVRELWSPQGALELDESLLPDGDESFDWTHTNYLSYDSSEQAYYLSMRNLGLVAKVDRASGDLLWLLGDDGADFQLQGEPDLLCIVHSIEPVEGGVLLFDQTMPAANFCPGMSLVELDEDAMTAEQVWSYAPEGCPQVGWGGNAVELADGSRTIDLGCAGRIEGTTAEDELAWSVESPLDFCLGYTSATASLYGQDSGGSR